MTLITKLELTYVKQIYSKCFYQKTLEKQNNICLPLNGSDNLELIMYQFNDL